MNEKLFLILKGAIRDFVRATRDAGWEERKTKKVIRHMTRDTLKKYK
jgi:hypothetical protein